MIDKRQYKYLSYFLTRLLFIGGILNLLFKNGQNDLLLSSFLGMLLGYFLLYLFYKKKYINKYLIILLSILIMFISMLSNILLTSNYLLSKTPIFIISLVIILTGYYSTINGMKNLSRSTELLFIITFVLIIICYLGLFKSVRISSLLPLFSTKFSNIIKCIFIFSSTSLLPNLLIINYKDNLSFKDISNGYIMGCLSIIGIVFIIETIYGYSYASYLNFPEYMVLKRISFMNYINNIENILVMEWIVNIVIGVMVCSYNIYNYLGKNKYYFVMLLILVLLCILYNYHNLIFSIKWYIYLGLIILCLVIKKEK